MVNYIILFLVFNMITVTTSPQPYHIYGYGTNISDIKDIDTDITLKN